MEKQKGKLPVRQEGVKPEMPAPKGAILSLGELSAFREDADRVIAESIKKHGEDKVGALKEFMDAEVAERVKNSNPDGAEVWRDAANVYQGAFFFGPEAIKSGADEKAIMNDLDKFRDVHSRKNQGLNQASFEELDLMAKIYLAAKKKIVN